jgi:hypothetical protein
MHSTDRCRGEGARAGAKEALGHACLSPEGSRIIGTSACSDSIRAGAWRRRSVGR